MTEPRDVVSRIVDEADFAMERRPDPLLDFSVVAVDSLDGEDDCRCRDNLDVAGLSEEVDTAETDCWELVGLASTDETNQGNCCSAMMLRGPT